MQREWGEAVSEFVSLAQSPAPFRLAGAPGPERTEWWRAALESPAVTWWALAIGAAALCGALFVVGRWMIRKITCRSRGPRRAINGLAAAMGIDRGERACIERLSAAARISEPAAILMTPSAFLTAMHAGAALLDVRDRATLIAMAARLGWPLPDPGKPTPRATTSASLELKPRSKNATSEPRPADRPSNPGTRGPNSKPAVASRSGDRLVDRRHGAGAGDRRFSA